MQVGEYLWSKTQVNYSDGSSTKSYSVSRIGSDGSDGLPGTPGADGRTPYVHYAYANSPDGQTDFSTTYFAGALYVGTCSDYNQADPTDPAPYDWARLKGADGPRITEQYFLSTSNTQLLPSTNQWQDDAPQWSAGHYIWTRSKFDYGDGDITYSDPVCATGPSGADAPNLIAEYSADASDWHPVYTETDLWMRTSNDGGQNWSPAIRITGANYSPNLLLDSNFSKNDKSGWANTLPIEEEDGIRYYHPIYNWTCYQRLNYEPGTYTFSALVRNTGSAKSQLRLNIETAPAQVNILIDVQPNSGWHRVYGSAKVAVSQDNVRTFVLLNGPTQPETIDVAELKLEKGENTAPVWSPSASEIAADPEARAIIDQLVPGAAVRLRDPRFILNAQGTPAPYETLYISNINIEWREPSADSPSLLPDVEITLSDKYEVAASTVSRIQSEIDALARHIASIGNIEQLIRAVGDKLYLRKDGIPDLSMSPTQLDISLRVSKSSGAFATTSAIFSITMPLTSARVIPPPPPADRDG